MTWPTPQDYNEALQSPRINFEDVDLRAGIPDVTPLGLPRPITGGFASVYSVRSNSKRWAVRCFLRDFSDHRERYGAIAQHLANANLPYMVRFEFLEKGIRVRGQWYPILKMEWIEGLSFHEAIEANITNSEALRSLAERWVKMCAALKKHSIAHGDLQHGNILISNGEFRLIDYDGMFVPALSGRESHEVGHRNYQHPGRTESDFGPHLDNFSAWVIYFTLMALSIEPGLWNRYGNSQEHLLFQKGDFDALRFSRVFRSLQHMQDDRIQKYLPLFESFLGLRLQGIASPADVIGTKLKKRQSWQTSLPGWFSQQLSIFAPAEVAPAQLPVLAPPAPPVAPAPSSPEPLPDVVPDLPAPTSVAPAPAVTAPLAAPLSVPVTFDRSFVAERVLLACYAVFAAILVTVSARGILPAWETTNVLLAGLACVVLCLSCSYALSPEVGSRLRLRSRSAWLRASAPVARLFLAFADTWRTRIVQSEATKLARLDRQALECVQSGKDRIGRLRQVLSQNAGGFLGRARARLRILKVRRQYRRERDHLKIQIAEVRFRFRWRKEVLQRIHDRSEMALHRIRQDLVESQSELARYRTIRFSKYVLRIIGF
jgi:hypothetical protein